MKEIMKHTPLPWSLVVRQNDASIESIKGSRNVIFHRWSDGENPIPLDDKDKANLELIVHRVNNFERLERALSGLVAECKMSADFHPSLRSAIALNEAVETLAAAKQNKLNPTPSDSGD